MRMQGIRTGLVVVALGAWVTPSPAQQIVWNKTKVEFTANDVGYSSSIAIHPTTQGEAISYYDATAGALRLAWRQPAGQGDCSSDWKCVELDNAGNSGISSSMRYTPSGAWAIGYVDQTNKFAKMRFSDGGYLLWGLSGGNTTDVSVGVVSLAQVNNDWWETFKYHHKNTASGYSFTDLTYVKTNNPGSLLVGVDSDSDEDGEEHTTMGRYSSMDTEPVNGVDVPNVAYTNSFGTSLGLAEWNWFLEKWDKHIVIDPGFETGNYISYHAKKSPWDKRQVAYYDATNKKLKYARFVGGNAKCTAPGIPGSPTGAAGWECLTIDDVGFSNTGMGVSLAVYNNKPVIAYYDANDRDNGVLKLARPVEGSELGNCGPSSGLFGSWICTTVDDGKIGASYNDRGKRCSLALDNQGLASISYYDFSSKDLRFAEQIKLQPTPTNTPTKTPTKTPTPPPGSTMTPTPTVPPGSTMTPTPTPVGPEAPQVNHSSALGQSVLCLLLALCGGWAVSRSSTRRN